MNIIRHIFILFILIFSSYSSRPEKNTLNNSAIGLDSLVVNDSVNNKLSTPLTKDSCIKITKLSRDECLASFFNSSNNCEQGYSIIDSSNYFFKKVYLKSLAKNYLFAFFEKSNNSKIYVLNNGKWLSFHSLPDSLFFFFPEVCQCSSSDFAVPTIKIIDLNGDRIQDIQIVAHTNINGNQYSYLCLTDTINKTLIYIDYLFSNPEYNYKTHRLQEIELTSVGRNGFQATYKVDGFTITPDIMLEDDKSEINWQNDQVKGLKLNVYRGTGSINNRATWELFKSYKDAPDSIYTRWYKIIGSEYY